jgi:hypothetical protein
MFEYQSKTHENLWMKISLINWKNLFVLIIHIQRDIIEHVDNRSDKEIVGTLKKIPIAENLSGPARGKIRYVGFVIAKLKYRNSRAIRSSLLREKMI